MRPRAPVSHPAEHPGIDQFRGRGASSSGIQVGFVDAEGQGDRDTAYDARIACPVLLAAKSCIFNWRDSLQKDKILEQLGIMCRAAQSVDLSEGGKMTSRVRRVRVCVCVCCWPPALLPAAIFAQRTHERDMFSVHTFVSWARGSQGEKPFGHLNIVFRDWNYDGDRNSVASQLLDIERAAGSVDAERRNEVRRALSASFESISVWLLPAPVERTADLRCARGGCVLLSRGQGRVTNNNPNAHAHVRSVSDSFLIYVSRSTRHLSPRSSHTHRRVLKPNMLSQEFRSAAGNLRAAISQQLTTPRIFGGQTVTGPVLARVVPIIAEALNDGNLVLPCSAYESMLRMELQLIRTEFDNAVEESVRAVRDAPRATRVIVLAAPSFRAVLSRRDLTRLLLSCVGCLEHQRASRRVLDPGTGGSLRSDDSPKLQGDVQRLRGEGRGNHHGSAPHQRAAGVAPEAY